MRWVVAQGPDQAISCRFPHWRIRTECESVTIYEGAWAGVARNFVEIRRLSGT